MTGLSDVLQLRVRYSETDQMGTFYNSRALEWFECGRTELMRRRLGMSYAVLEARGVFLPLVEAHLEFQGGARYDDLLEIASTVDVSGRAKLRFDVQIHHGESRKAVVRGYTVHAFTDRQGKPIRPPTWFIEMLAKAAADAGPADGLGLHWGGGEFGLRASDFFRPSVFGFRIWNEGLSAGHSSFHVPGRLRPNPRSQWPMAVGQEFAHEIQHCQQRQADAQAPGDQFLLHRQQWLVFLLHLLQLFANLRFFSHRS